MRSIACFLYKNGKYKIKGLVILFGWLDVYLCLISL